MLQILLPWSALGRQTPYASSRRALFPQSLFFRNRLMRVSRVRPVPGGQYPPGPHCSCPKRGRNAGGRYALLPIKAKIGGARRVRIDTLFVSAFVRGCVSGSESPLYDAAPFRMRGDIRRLAGSDVDIRRKIIRCPCARLEIGRMGRSLALRSVGRAAA